MTECVCVLPECGEEPSEHGLHRHEEQEDHHARQTRGANLHPQQAHNRHCLEGPHPQEVQEDSHLWWKTQSERRKEPICPQVLIE